MKHRRLSSLLTFDLMDAANQARIQDGTLSAFHAGPCCLSSDEVRKAKNREKQRRYAEKHPERVKAYNKKSKAKRKDKDNARRKQRRMENLEKARAAVKAYNEANREKVLERRRKWAAANRERLIEKKRELRKKKADKIREQKRLRYARSNGEELRKIKQWRAANPEKMRSYEQNPERMSKRRQRSKNQVAEATDGYIKDLLKEGTGLKRSDLPQELVELKRKQLKIKRQLKTNEP